MFKRRSALLISSALFFTFGVYLFFFSDRFVSIFISPRDLLLRFESIQIGLEIVKNNWLIGTGLNNYFLYQTEFQKDFSPIFFQPPHNIYVLVLLHTGILGLILFLTLLYNTWHELNMSRKIKNGLGHEFNTATILIFLILLIVGLTDHFFLSLQQGLLFRSVLIGFAWGKVRPNT